MAVKKKLVGDLEAELSRRVDIERPKQTFKLQMSLVFAVIVALVIIGFFWVAFKDEKVRQEIFAGQAGIQFITLFSLVIAIILFAKTGRRIEAPSARLCSPAGRLATNRRLLLWRTLPNR